jgi:hypothetical protein
MFLVKARVAAQQKLVEVRMKWVRWSAYRGHRLQDCMWSAKCVTPERFAREEGSAERLSPNPIEKWVRLIKISLLFWKIIEQSKGEKGQLTGQYFDILNLAYLTRLRLKHSIAMVSILKNRGLDRQSMGRWSSVRRVQSTKNFRVGALFRTLNYYNAASASAYRKL